MNVVTRLLGALSTVHGPVRIDDLARDLGVEASALEGMLDVLHHKGLLERPSVGTDSMVCAPGCGSSCSGAASCPFVAGVRSGQSVAVRLQPGTASSAR